MSKIEEIIKEKCPNGVEYKTIKEITNVLRGKRLTTKELSENGEFPVYHGGLEPLGYYHEFNRIGDTVMIINVGASAGTVGYCKDNFWSSDGCYCIEHRNVILNRYLYHYLKNNEQYFMGRVRKAGIPTLDGGVIEKFKIAVPPIEVQEEIVKILDKFGELEAELEVELEAELEVRKSQYEFWRGKMFEFDNESEYIELEKLSTILTKQTGFDYSNYIKSSLVDTCSYNTLPYIQTKFFSGKKFDYNTDYYIPIEVASRFPKILLKEKCILLSIVGASIGNIGLYDGTKEAFLGGAIGLIKFKDYVNIDYVYHYLNSPYGQCQIKNNIKGSGQASLTIESIRKFKIPYPKEAVQNHIVDVLDKFDKLVNDISEGLSAEIDARRKQYEYYRNKLLSFEEVSCE